MTIRPFNYNNPQDTSPVGGNTGQIKPFQYELAPAQKTPVQPIEFKPVSATKETIKALPSSVAENLPFGVGSIVKFAKEDPESVYNLSFEDVLQGIVDTSKGVYKGVIGAGVNLAPVPVKFNVPVLGEVTNAQFRAAERIRNGEDPTIVTLEEGAGAVFDTLMLVGLVSEVASPRPITIAKGQIPEGITTKTQPKSFRIYNEPVATQTLSPDFVQKMAETKGVTLGKFYNPELPTYFKMTGKANGKITGEVVQLKPSYVDTFLNVLKGNTSKVPETQTRTLISQTVDSSNFKNIKPAETVSPTVTNNMKIAPTPVETIPFDPNAVAKTVIKNPTTSDKTSAILDLAMGDENNNPIDTQAIIDTIPQEVQDQFLKEYPPKSNKTGKTLMGDLENYMQKLLDEYSAKQEPSNVLSETEKLDQQLQAQAEEDWTNTVADDYAQLQTELDDLKKEMSTASKSDKQNINTKIDEINTKLGNIEDTFVQKWTDKAKTAKVPKSEKPTKTKAVEKISAKKDDVTTPEGVAKNLIRSYVERGDDFKSIVSGQMGMAGSDYSASIGGYLNGKKIPSTSIGISRIGDKEVNVVLPLKRIFDEIKAEKKATVSKEILKPKKPISKNEKIQNTQNKTELEILKDTVASNPLSVNTKNDRLLYDIKEGGIKSLADVKSPKLARIIEDRMAEAGISDPQDFVDKYEKLQEQKARIKELEKGLKGKQSSSFASMDRFREDIAPTEKTIQEDVKPIEFPELVRLARNLIGDFPVVKMPRFRPSMGGNPLGLFTPTGDGKITLNPDLFKKGNEQQVARTLAHEIGHLIDYLPEKTLARGNVLGRLASLKNFRKDFFSDAGITRTNSAMKQELWNLSKYWKPIDEETASKGFLAYRKSPEEVYADFISVLFNNPKLAQQIAPESYNTFFKRLDQKPDVKVAYFELQQLLSGTREEVLKARSADIKAGFEKAEDLQKDFADKKELANKSSWERLRQQLDDINYPILKRQKALEAKGQSLPPELSPKYLLEEQSFADNENFLMMLDIDTKIDKPLQDAGLTREDFGEFLFLNRVVGKENVPAETLAEEAVKGEASVGTDRQTLANPFGFNVDSAKEQLDFIKKSLGEEKYAVLEQTAKEFHDIVFKSVEEAVKTGAYNKELFDTKIKPNKDTYVTFAVVDYLQDKVPATVKAQYGTLKEIANPYTSTILKTIALNRLNAYQRAKVATKALLEKTGEITPSKAITDGKLTIYKVAPNKGEFTLLEDGKLKSYDVDPYIAESFKRDKVGDLNTIVWLLDTFNNKLFKPLVTTYNLGFAAAFNPIRDFKRNYKLIPNATVGNLLSAYVKSLPEAIKYTKGELGDFTRSLVESKAINAPSSDYQFDLSDDSEYQRLLERYGLVAKKDGGVLKDMPKVANLTKVLLKPVTKTLEGMRFIANTLEIVSKIGGAKVRIAGGESGKELAYNLRNYTGTPNFRRKGLQTRTTNAIFTFSNIMKEGLKTDIQFATNPNTRGGYWWKTAKIDLLPKFLMFLATAGYLGKELKDMFDKMSEYDKTNYITIPLGETANGKVTYIRIPHDETGRLVSAVFWKMLNFAKNGDTKELQDVFAYGAGQLPSVNPAITLLNNWSQYLSGRNPYDAFRGRTLIDDTTFTAGGGASLKKMAEWTVNELGLASFATYDTSKDTTLETFTRVSPFFNRVLKITDYGLTEQLNKTVKSQKQAEAKQSLLKREILQDYTKKIDKPEDITPILLIDLEKAIYGKDSNDKSKRTALRTSLLKNLIRNDSPEINSLLTATSNAQKVATLKEIQKNISPTEFSDLKLKLIKYKIVSQDLIKTIK